MRTQVIRSLIALICMLMLAGPVFAGGTAGAAGSVITSDVDVDATGNDAADAREQAMAKSQIDALTDLVSRFTSSDQAQQIVSSLDAKQISAMSRGTEVLSEKISSNRYRASLRVSFDADEISKLIGNNGANNSGASQPTKIGSFLIIPSYEEAGNILLWDEGNPWRNAWKATGLESTTGGIVVPYGDATDASVLDAKNLQSATFSSLLAMTVRYGVTDVILLHAKFSPGSDAALEVIKRRINRTQNEVNVLTYRADLQETRETLMARATHDIVESLERKKNEEAESLKSVTGGDHHTLMMLVSVSTLNSWTQLRTKLSALPMIDKLETLAISPQQVDLVVHYRGAPDSLANAITGLNIRLVQNKDYWVISRD